jgi:hypothetical protein
LKKIANILSLFFAILFCQNGFCQTSLTENTADEIHIAPNVEWSDWGSNYTNGFGGNVRNYGVFIFYGNKFTNNGSYFSNAGSKDSFITSIVDTISGTNRPRFYDLVLNNGSNNFIINNDSGIEVQHNINFASLIVSTERSNTNIGSINLADDATYTGIMSNTKFVDGYVTKVGNDAFVFPVGNSNKYHPLTISSPSSLNYQLSVSYFYDNPAIADLTGGLHSLSSLASPLTSIDNTQFWDVVTSSTDSISVTLHFESLVGKYLNASNVRMVGWNIANARWEIIGTNIPSGLTSGSTITNDSVNLSRYSAIGIGSTLEVLPVELLSLNVQKIDNQNALIQWTTASEKNNLKFEIERSIDLHNFQKIGEKLGNINSSGLNNYQFMDLNPVDTKNYYRLKQIDINGDYKYSEILFVDFSTNNSEPNDIQISLLNSLSNPEIRIITSENFKASNFAIQIFDIEGRLVEDLEKLNIQASSNTILPIKSNDLKNGIYFISIHNVSLQEGNYTFKLIR